MQSNKIVDLQGQIYSCKENNIVCKEYSTAISGEGFFPIKDGKNLYYTRVGDFFGNKLKLGKKYNLYVWSEGQEKDFNDLCNNNKCNVEEIKKESLLSLTTIKNDINEKDGLLPTSFIKFNLNLDVREKPNSLYNFNDDRLIVNRKIEPHFSQYFDIIDNKGFLHRMIASFVKTKNSFWQFELYPVDNNEVKRDKNIKIVKDEDKEKILLRHNELIFDHAGNLIIVAGEVENLSINWENGANNNLRVLLGCEDDFEDYLSYCGKENNLGLYGNITQKAKVYTTLYNSKVRISIENDPSVINKDGQEAKNFKKFEFDNLGNIFQVFENNYKIHKYSFAIAKFDNVVSDLKPHYKNIYKATKLPKFYKVSSEEVGNLIFNSKEKINIIPRNSNDQFTYTDSSLDYQNQEEEADYKLFNEFKIEYKENDIGTSISVKGKGFLILTCSNFPKKYFLVKSFTSTEQDKFFNNKSSCYLVGFPLENFNNILPDYNDLVPIAREFYKHTEKIYIGKQVLNLSAKPKGKNEYRYYDNNKNLASGSVKSDAKEIVTEVVDYLGFSHNINFGFIKTDVDKEKGYTQWHVEIYTKELGGKQLNHGEIVFNQNSEKNPYIAGSINRINKQLNEIIVLWPENTSNHTILMNWGDYGNEKNKEKKILPEDSFKGIRELYGGSKSFWGTDPIINDGITPEMQAKFEIDINGKVSIKYSSNKVNKEIIREKFLIFIAKVEDEQSLIIKDNYPGFIATEDSGDIKLELANKNGFGQIIMGLNATLIYEDPEF